MAMLTDAQFYVCVFSMFFFFNMFHDFKKFLGSGMEKLFDVFVSVASSFHHFTRDGKI